MSTPAADPTMPDPSQVFADPSQMAALQGGQPPAQGPPEQSDQGEQQGEYQHEPIDLEGCIAEAIESGCHLASAAVSPEDYMRFSQGVSFLATALKDIQPQPMDPAAASLASTALQADQRHAQATMQTDQRHAQAMAQVAASREAAASRPTSAQPSARG